MIHRAHDSDATAIAALRSPVIGDTVVTIASVENTGGDINAVTAVCADAGRPFLVADADGELRGFATCFQFRSGPGDCALWAESLSVS